MVMYLLVIVGLTLAWRDPVLRQYMEPAALARTGQSLLAMPLGPLMVLAGYVLAVVLAMPVAVLITVGALVFGPWPGIAYTLVGMVSGAIVTYGIGLYSGAQLVDRWSTQGRIHALALALKRRGLWAIIVIRAVPVAPFVVVNMTAGAFRVRFRDYVLGSFIGLAPGTIMISLFMDRLTAALAEPDATTYGLLAAVVMLFGGVLWWFKRLMARGQASH
ncbi:MAG TPA: VTT domain-containing protein [Aquabacterium sp.]|uniref:TVP38/TMEM64 family protein n=1 Tax=Aquabacterium sp. TaxID=1872578 RepID=UPI002E32E785|nr:VTT domain-containing protein [Aquabacterium sp.]HEX5373669.1 VTT domain-containing protein [Aquabacterium sp.]